MWVFQSLDLYPEILPHIAQKLALVCNANALLFSDLFGRPAYIGTARSLPDSGLNLFILPHYPSTLAAKALQQGAVSSTILGFTSFDFHGGAGTIPLSFPVSKIPWRSVTSLGCL